MSVADYTYRQMNPEKKTTKVADNIFVNKT